MPERAGRSDGVRAARPVRAGSVTLLPIERAVVRPGRRGGGAWVSAALEPYALIVRDADGVRVIDLAGCLGAGALALEQLRERVPVLDALLTPA